MTHRASLRTSVLSSAVLAAFFTFMSARAFAASDNEGAADVKAAGKTTEHAPQPPPVPTAPPAPTAPAAAAPQAPQDPNAPRASGEGAAPPPANPAEKTWEIVPYGYVRFGYENVATDTRYDFVGRNNGFILDSARAGIEGHSETYHVTFRIAAEGASDVQSGINTPVGALEVRLRDAFVRYDLASWVGVQGGQFKAPFDAEELRGTQDLLFVSRAVAQLGVLPGRGFQESGIAIDRQLGVMLSPEKPIYSGDFGFAYYAMVYNGNGQNQLLNDNSRVGVVGRLEGLWSKHVVLGAAVLRNERTVGALPNLYDETDLGFDGDLGVRVGGLDLFTQVAGIRTSYPTVGAADRLRLGYHAQIGYRFETPIPFAPAYRYAHYHPWQGGGDNSTGQDYDSFKLDYHTFGVKVWHPSLPLVGWVNYTLTMEPAARQLTNNRLEILTQVTF